MEDKYLTEETDDEINDSAESEEKSVNTNIEDIFDTYFDKFNNGDLDATLSKAASKTIDAIVNSEDCSKEEAREIWDKYAQEKGLHIPEVVENLNEDWYGEDDSYFSREELDEFGYSVAEYMMDIVKRNFISYNGAYIDKNEIEITMSESEWELEETVKFKIDFRKIKKPSDLNKYIPAVANAIAKKFAQDGIEDFEDFDQMQKHSISHLPKIEDEDDIGENLNETNNSSIFEIQNGVLIKYNGKRKHVVLPNDVIEIGEDVFRDKGLQSVDCPNVKKIGSNAFWNCQNLQSINCPNAEEIGLGAFYKCTNLQSVDCPNVKKIGQSAFYKCEKLPYVEFPNTITVGFHAFKSCLNLKHIYIPIVITIEEGAFMNCALSSIDIPNSTIKIGSWAFAGCDSLPSIEIPDSVNEIGKLAFFRCQSITSAKISNSLTIIPEEMFNGCKLLPSIVIPESVTKIERNAFIYCDSLESIIIPDSVVEIGSNIVWNCKKHPTIYTNNKYVQNYCDENNIDWEFIMSKHSISHLDRINDEPDIEEDLNNDITKAPFYKKYIEWENFWNDRGYKTDSYDKEGVYIPVIDPWTGYEIWNSDWKVEEDLKPNEIEYHKVGLGSFLRIYPTLKNKYNKYSYYIDPVIHTDFSGRKYISIRTIKDKQFNWLNMYAPTEGDFDVKYSVLHAFCFNNPNVIDEKTFTKNFSQNDMAKHSINHLPRIENEDDIEEALDDSSRHEYDTDDLDIDTFDYILNNDVTYKDIVDHYDGNFSKSDYDRMMKAISDFHPDIYYDRGEHLELSHNRTQYDIMDLGLYKVLDDDDNETDEFDDEMYWIEVQSFIESFNEYMETDVSLRGTNGRHVCIEPTAENILRYNEIKNIWKKCEEAFINGKDPYNVLFSDGMIKHSINHLPKTEDESDIEEDLNNDITQAPYYKEYMEWNNRWGDKIGTYIDNNTYVCPMNPWTGHMCLPKEELDSWDYLDEDTIKTRSSKWVNKGDSGKTHGNFKTKKAADAQRKAMFANGYHEDLDRKAYDYRDIIEQYLYVKYEIIGNDIDINDFDYVMVNAVNTNDYSIFVASPSEKGKSKWPYSKHFVLIGISEHNSVTWNKWSNWYNFDEYTNNKDIHQSNGCTIIKFGEFDKRSECYSASGKAISGQLNINGKNFEKHSISHLPRIEDEPDIEEDYNRLTTKSGKWISYIEK